MKTITKLLISTIASTCLASTAMAQTLGGGGTTLGGGGGSGAYCDNLGYHFCPAGQQCITEACTKSYPVPHCWGHCSGGTGGNPPPPPPPDGCHADYWHDGATTYPLAPDLAQEQGYFTLGFTITDQGNPYHGGVSINGSLGGPYGLLTANFPWGSTVDAGHVNGDMAGAVKLILNGQVNWMGAPPPDLSLLQDCANLTLPTWDGAGWNVGQPINR